MHGWYYVTNKQINLFKILSLNLNHKKAGIKTDDGEMNVTNVLNDLA